MSATKTQALLEEARKKLGGVTDYKLAQVMKIPRQRVSNYRNGERQADNYACARIAEILEKDALEIIAAVEAENAKTEERRDYWRSFRGSGRTAILGLLSFGIAGFFASELQTGKAEAASLPDSHNVYYVKLSVNIKQSGYVAENKATPPSNVGSSEFPDYHQKFWWPSLQPSCQPGGMKF